MTATLRIGAAPGGAAALVLTTDGAPLNANEVESLVTQALALFGYRLTTGGEIPATMRQLALPLSPPIDAEDVRREKATAP